MKTPRADQEYLDALMSNDSPVIGEIYALFAGRVLKMVTDRNGTVEDARDIFQETLIVLTRKARAGYQFQVQSFEGLLMLISFAAWVTHWKKNGRHEVTNWDDERYDIGEDEKKIMEQIWLEAAQYDLFRRCFLQLGKSCQEILDMAWQGEKMNEIAKQRGITYNYVRKQKAECIQRLTGLIKKAPEYKTLAYPTALSTTQKPAEQ